LAFFRNSVLSGPLLGDLCIGDDDGNKHALWRVLAIHATSVGRGKREQRA
jgi:hypothetical protein